MEAKNTTLETLAVDLQDFAADLRRVSAEQIDTDRAMAELADAVSEIATRCTALSERVSQVTTLVHLLGESNATLIASVTQLMADRDAS